MPFTEWQQRYRQSPKGRATNAAYRKRYYHEVLKLNPAEVEKRRKANRLNHYKRNYGLTPEEADALKAAGCALCGIKVGKLNVDHDHKTGRFRGILCNPCNLMIGWLEKAQPKMETIKEYLNAVG